MTWHEIAGLFEKIELRLIQSLKRNLARHKAWEQEEGFDWPAWQAEKLENLEHFRQENKVVMQEYTDVIDLETRRLMEGQFEEGGLQVDEELEDAPAPLPENAFFGVNEPRMENLIQDIQQVEQRAESAALRMMDDVYRRTLLQAETAMSAGAVTLPQAIDMAVKDFLQQGIACIEYKDGSRHNIADYVQMALRTTATRSYLQGEAARRAEYGIDTVLVSQYGQCSNTCLPWQGRVYIDDVWGDFQGKNVGGRGKSKNGSWYPLLSVAVANGLFHPNCRHTLSTWYEGISKMPEPLDGEKIRRDAALEQRQRVLEKTIREYKRMAEGMHEQNLVKEYKRKTADAQKELREFIAEHSNVLRRDYWREKTYDVPIEKSREDVILKTDIQGNSSLTIDSGKQGKHIIGHNNYISGRSYLTVSEEEVQRLVNQYAGTGELLRDKGGKWKNQESVHTDQIIGYVVDKETGQEEPTTDFKIHYSRTGVHIVPVRRPQK